MDIFCVHTTYGCRQRLSIVDLIIKEFDGVLIDDYGWEHHKIDGKRYDIRFDRSRVEWACDCPAFTYRYKFKKKYCKHILEIQDKKFNQRYR
tara:strand:- start:7 stop:282 length:276 start_codon:yes stop_codon:yes gene_type:complete